MPGSSCPVLLLEWPNEPSGNACPSVRFDCWAIHRQFVSASMRLSVWPLEIAPLRALADASGDGGATGHDFPQTHCHCLATLCWTDSRRVDFRLFRRQYATTLAQAIQGDAQCQSQTSQGRRSPVCRPTSPTRSSSPFRLSAGAGRLLLVNPRHYGERHEY